MAVPNIFATATSSIPLSQLDTNFATAITLGSTALYLGNTTTSVAGLTLTGGAFNGTVGATTPSTGAFTTLSATGATTLATSSGNVLIGTSTDFTSTTVSGGVEVAGYGIYPYVSGGTTNSTIYTGLNSYTPTAFSGTNGASAQTFYAGNFVANVKNDGSGGILASNSYGIQANASVESTGVGARVRAQGVGITVSRYSATDLSTRTDHILVGLQTAVNQLTSAATSVVTGQFTGILNSCSNQNGGATTQIGIQSSCLSGTQSTSPGTTSTDMYNFYQSSFGVGHATGSASTVTTGAGFYAAGPSVSATGTLTTYYGLYLGSATVTGTLTNNWGVYSADTAANNYCAGKLLVGTTSGTADKATFAAATTTTNVLAMVSTDDSSGGLFAVFRNSTYTSIGNIARVTTTNAVIYNTTSDYRLKTVVGAVTGQGERIDALKPIDYLWTEGGQQARGFLAHEFQEVYASSVTGTKDAVDEDGNPIYQGMQAGTAEVIADLVAELQSLRKRITALEAK